MDKFSEFVAAGYFVTKYVDRPKYVSPELIPSRIVTLTPCIASYLPDTWALSWVKMDAAEREAAARNFGITAGPLQEFIEFVTGNFDKRFGWPNVCLSLADAQFMCETFLSQNEDIVVIGLGIHQSFLHRFTEALSPPPVEPGLAPEGMYTMVKKRENLQAGGAILGFEPFCDNYGTAHSWLCNGLETAVHKDLGIQFNEHGFIEVFEEACKCVEYIGREEVGAEPGLWVPGLIVRYK